MPKPLIVYDGECALCTRSVRFLQKRQRLDTLDYAPQQSGRGKIALKGCGLDKRALETVVLIEGTQCYQRSSAALRAFRFLRFPWPLLFAFILVPSFLRDPVYNLIAHNRYRWFGRIPRE